MAHKDIRFLFTVEDRKYEAVGYLNESEDSVSRDTMLERTAAENGGAIGEEDERFLSERRFFLDNLEQYWLATNRLVNEGIAVFHMQGGKWSLGTLYNSYNSHCLVVRRLS